MALNPHLSIAARNRALDAAFDVLNGGSVRYYDGLQPATVETALSGNTLVVSMAMSATAYAPASGGAKVMNAVTGAPALATTTAITWGSQVTSGGTRVRDFTIGTSGTDLVLTGGPGVSIGTPMTFTTWTETQAP
jgi:hypothetical protein